MAGFVISAGTKVVKYGLPILKEIVTKTAKGTVYVVKPAGQFTRGALTGAPKYVTLAGGNGVRTATVGVFLRAGIQTRQATAYVVKAAVLKGPRTTAQFVKYWVRSAVRDTLTVPYATQHLYQIYRAERVAKGLTSVAERAADKFIPVVGKQLARFGLEARLSGYAGTLARAPLYGVAFEGLKSLGEKIDASERYVLATVENYKSFSARARAVVGGGVAPGIPEPTAIPAPVPAGIPDRERVVVPIQPSVPTSPKGAAIVYTPPVRRGR